MSESFNDNPLFSDSLWQIANSSQELQQDTNYDKEEVKPVIMDCLDEIGNPLVLSSNIYSNYNPNLHYRKRPTNYDKNQHPLEKVYYTVERNYERLFNRSPNLEKVQNFVQSHQPVNYSENRDFERIKKIALWGGGIAAIGLTSFLVSSLPTPPENAVETFKTAANISGGVTSISVAGVLLSSTYYLAKSLRVAALSFSDSFISKIVESNKERLYLDNAVLSLLEDIKADKKDFSLTFAKHFIHNADLKGNSKSVNRKIISGVAYYRDMQLKFLRREGVSKEELERAYGVMISVFEEAMGMEGCSVDFYNGEYINSIINDYHIRQGENNLGINKMSSYGKIA